MQFYLAIFSYLDSKNDSLETDVPTLEMLEGKFYQIEKTVSNLMNSFSKNGYLNQVCFPNCKILMSGPFGIP